LGCLYETQKFGRTNLSVGRHKIEALHFLSSDKIRVVRHIFDVSC
jgi:hypothetical protein